MVNQSVTFVGVLGIKSDRADRFVTGVPNVRIVVNNFCKDLAAAQQLAQKVFDERAYASHTVLRIEGVAPDTYGVNTITMDVENELVAIATWEHDQVKNLHYPRYRYMPCDTDAPTSPEAHNQTNASTNLSNSWWVPLAEALLKAMNEPTKANARAARATAITTGVHKMVQLSLAGSTGDNVLGKVVSATNYFLKRIGHTDTSVLILPAEDSCDPAHLDLHRQLRHRCIYALDDAAKAEAINRANKIVAGENGVSWSIDI